MEVCSQAFIKEHCRVTVRVTRLSQIFLGYATSVGTTQDLRCRVLLFGSVGEIWYSHSKGSLTLSRVTDLLVLSSRSGLKPLFILNVSLIQS